MLYFFFKVHPVYCLLFCSIFRFMDSLKQTFLSGYFINKHLRLSFMVSYVSVNLLAGCELNTEVNVLVMVYLLQCGKY